MVPDRFCHCFQGDQRWLAQAMNIASRACAVSLPKRVAAHFFSFQRELPWKTKWRMVSVVFRSSSTSSSSQTKVRSVVFISFSFGFGAFLFSPASMIRKLRTLLLWGTSTWSNAEERHWQAKETSKQTKNTIWARGKSVSVKIEHSGQRPWFSDGDTSPRDNPHPCGRGLRIDVRHVWTPQNESSRKRIFLKTYTCARSLKHLCRSLWQAEAMAEGTRLLELSERAKLPLNQKTTADNKRQFMAQYHFNVGSFRLILWPTAKCWSFFGVHIFLGLFFTDRRSNASHSVGIGYAIDQCKKAENVISVKLQIVIFLKRLIFVNRNFSRFETLIFINWDLPSIKTSMKNPLVKTNIVKLTSLWNLRKLVTYENFSLNSSRCCLDHDSRKHKCRAHERSIIINSEWVLAGYSLLIPFSHHTRSQIKEVGIFFFCCLLENGWVNPAKTSCFAKTDCWCDEKRELKYHHRFALYPTRSMTCTVLLSVIPYPSKFRSQSNLIGSSRYGNLTKQRRKT